ncbi:MAG: type II toxin-antitoxin system prevent-host-death family antitoxin [Nitrospira sp.]|nr:type II toxin-antitoxin system prevent-host-death family antitoxin [Nitrospira sp.]
MPKLTFRNRRGQITPIATVTATKAKNEFGAVLEQTLHIGAVAITRHETPKAVLLSMEEFESLVQGHTNPLDELSQTFDQLLARMQTPQARRGVEAAFSASPEKLGRAAVSEAKQQHATARKRTRRARGSART